MQNTLSAALWYTIDTLYHIIHYNLQWIHTSLIIYIIIVYSDDEWILQGIWDSEQSWYKTQEVIIREKEEKWSVDMREKDMKRTSLQSSESSLKYTIDMLNKRETIKLVNHSHWVTLKFLPSELAIEKKLSLMKSQELDYSRKQVTYLKRKLKLTTNLPSGLY